MIHEELSELYELYVLGVLDTQERIEVEEHLARNCSVCQAGVRNALALAAMFGSLAEPIQPPKRLRKRVLASVGYEPQSNRLWLTALGFVAACLLIGVIVLSVESTRRNQELAVVQAQLRQSSADLAQSQARMQAALQFLNQPDTQQVVFGKGLPQPPRGRVFVNARRGVLLMASNLAPAPSGKIYEMWLLPKTGAPIPAGLFQSDAQGNALYLRSEPLDLPNTKAVAVTLEPESGSPAPTTTPIIAAGLSE